MCGLVIATNKNTRRKRFARGGIDVFETRGTTLLESIPPCAILARGGTLHSFQARSVLLQPDALLLDNGELPAGATGHEGLWSRVVARQC